MIGVKEMTNKKLVDQYVKIKDASLKSGKIIEELKKEINFRMDKRDIDALRGSLFNVIRKSLSKRVFNSKKFKDENPLIYEEYKENKEETRIIIERK